MINLLKKLIVEEEQSMTLFRDAQLQAELKAFFEEEKQKNYSAKFQKLISQPDVWMQKLKRAEHLLFTRFLPQAIAETAFPVGFLSKGEPNKLHEETMKAIFTEAQFYALNEFLTTLVEETYENRKNSTGTGNALDELEIHQIKEETRAQLYNRLYYPMVDSIEAKMTDGRLPQWFGVWLNRLKTSLTQDREIKEKKYKVKLIEAASQVRLLNDPLLLPDELLSKVPVSIYSALKTLGTALGPDFKISQRAHDWYTNYVFEQKEWAASLDPFVHSEHQNQYVKILEMGEKLLKSCPALKNIKLQADMDRNWFSDLYNEMTGVSEEQCKEKTDILDYKFYIRLLYILGYTGSNTLSIEPGMEQTLFRLQVLIGDNKKLKAFALYYRLIQQRLIIAQYRILDFQISVPEDVLNQLLLRPKELEEQYIQKSRNNLEEQRKLGKTKRTLEATLIEKSSNEEYLENHKKNYDGKTPLFNVIGQDKFYDSTEDAYIDRAIYEVINNIHKQLNCINAAKRIEDLSPFIMESVVIDRMLGSLHRSEVLAKYGLGLGAITHRITSSIDTNKLALLKYHQGIRRKLFIAEKVKGSDFQTMISAYPSPLFSHQDEAVISFITAPIRDAFTDEIDIVNETYGTDSRLHGDSQSLYISMLDVFLLKLIVDRLFVKAPFKAVEVAQTAIHRFIGANWRISKGYLATIIPVTGVEAYYKNMYLGKNIEDGLGEFESMTFSEVDDFEMSFLSLEDFNRVNRQAKNQIQEYRNSIGWLAIFGAGMLIGPVYSRFKTAKQNSGYSKLERIYVNSRSGKSTFALETSAMERAYLKMTVGGRSIEDAYMFLNRKMNRLSESFRVYFEDLGLSVGTWNPILLRKRYKALMENPEISFEMRSRAKYAYEKLMSVLFKEFSALKNFPNVLEHKSIIFFGKYSKDQITMILDEGHKISQRVGLR